ELGEQEVDRRLETLDGPLRVRRRRGGDRAIPRVRQDLKEHLAHGGIALDDEDRLAAGRGEIHLERRAGARGRSNDDRAAALLRDPVGSCEAETDAVA